MIPHLVDVGSHAPWPVLPPGVHVASKSEIDNAFATTPHRKALFGGFVRLVGSLKAAGCSRLYLDGSFVTAKPHPSDFDAIWDYVGVDLSLVDLVLFDFTNDRAAQKAKYLGEAFPTSFWGVKGVPILDYFQLEKHSGKAKGILSVNLLNWS